MSTRHERIEDLFWRASQIESASDCDDFLTEACDGDNELRQEIERLLAARTAAEDFATALQPKTSLSKHDMTGEVIGPYKLREKIGEGGMGVVYTADQKTPVQRRVAIKVIKPGMDSSRVIARFEAERQTLAMMDHPNVAKILGAGTTEQGLPYFAMELVNGVPITRYCDDRRLTVRERLELLQPVCKAVHHAHQKGIIHRDIKPSNILVTQYDGEPLPKVIDFGIAKAVGSQLGDYSVYTEFGMLIGTLEYMSPEQAQRNQQAVDTRSDIYSLGVVLYELLSGATPFDGKRLRSAAFEEILSIIGNEQPPSPSLRASTSKILPDIATARSTEPARLARQVHGELDWIVMKALEKKPERRYGSAAEFSEDIARFLDSRPVEASPPSFVYSTRKLVARHKSVFGFALLLILSLVVGLGLTSWQAYRANLASELAELERIRATEERKRADQERDAALLAKTKAELESAYSTALSDFLTNELFGMASLSIQMDGGLRPDPDLKVRTLVERAVGKLEKMADNASARARMELVLGEVMLSIGRNRQAVPLLDSAVEYWTAHQGPDHGLTYRAQLRLAHALRNLGGVDEAIAILEKVVDSPEARLDLRAVALIQMANCWNRRGELERALQTALKCLDLIEGKSLPDPRLYFKAHRTAGNLAAALGQFETARHSLLIAYEGYLDNHGRDYPDTINTATELAAFYNLANEPENTIHLLEPYLEAIRSLYGEGSAAYQLSLSRIAFAYSDLDQLAESNQYFRQAYETAERTPGINASFLFRLGANLARSTRTAKGLEPAVELAESLAPMLPVDNGEPSSDLAQAVDWILEILWEAESFEVALQLSDRFLVQYDTYPLSVEPLWRIRGTHANLLSQLERYEEAAEEDAKLAEDLVKFGRAPDDILVFHHRYQSIIWGFLTREDWSGAAEAFAVEPTLAMWKYMEALTRLGAEDASGCQRAISRALEQFGETQDIETMRALCATAALQPIASKDRESWQALAETLLERATEMFQRRDAAAVLARCGQVERGKKLLIACYEETVNDESLAVSKLGVCMRLAILEMESGNSQESRRWLTEATQAYEALKPDTLPKRQWNLKLYYKVSRSEVLNQIDSEPESSDNE